MTKIKNKKKQIKKDEKNKNEKNKKSKIRKKVEQNNRRKYLNIKINGNFISL